MKEQQTFLQQSNILKSCLSDLSSDYLNFSLHCLLFRKFLTLADVGSHLIKTCNKLPKNQQFFKTELEKFNYGCLESWIPFGHLNQYFLLLL